MLSHPLDLEVNEELLEWHGVDGMSVLVHVLFLCAEFVFLGKTKIYLKIL